MLLICRLRGNLTLKYVAFDMARDGGDDWVEDRFYRGNKIEQLRQVEQLGQGYSVSVTSQLDIRQCHFPGEQNRAEDRYEEEAYNSNEEGQHVFQSLGPD